VDLDEVGVVLAEAPDVGQQLGLGKDAAGMAAERDQQLELGASQVDVVACLA
jgi:hypothetical protein